MRVLIWVLTFTTSILVSILMVKSNSYQKQIDSMTQNHMDEIVKVAEAYEYLGQCRAYEDIFRREDISWYINRQKLSHHTRKLDSGQPQQEEYYQKEKRSIFGIKEKAVSEQQER